MALILARGTPRDVCDRCQHPTLPVSLFVDQEEAGARLVICVVCLAEAIDVATGWNQTASILLALRRSDATNRFRNPLTQIQRARHRKPLHKGERFPQDPQEDTHGAELPAPPVEPTPEPPARRPARRSRSKPSGE